MGIGLLAAAVILAATEPQTRPWVGGAPDGVGGHVADRLVLPRLGFGGRCSGVFYVRLKAEVLTGVATLGLVVVTAVYARSTSQIARANAETVGATRQLAEETERMATATEAMATATQETLDHLQRPILVLECRAKSGTRVEVHVQNIGEGAAVWPAVYEAVGDGEKGVYVRELHVMGPQQFAMTNWDPSCSGWNCRAPLRRSA